MKLKSNNYFTKTYEIVEGVLQGESLSPLLFSIFIADMESYFYFRDLAELMWTTI